MTADARKGKSLFATTSNSFSVGEGVTITPNDVSGLPTGNLVLTFDREVTGKVERIKGAISGSNFVVASGGRGYDGTTEQAHTSPNVEYIYNGADQNDAVDAFVAEHSVAGVHSSALVTSLKATGAVVDTGTSDVTIVTPKAIADSAVTTPSKTQTLTNKRITSRVVTTTDDATAVIDTDITDVYILTAVANATTFTVSGTPTDEQKLIVRFKDAGVAKALTWTGFTSRGATLPTTTVAGKWHRVGLMYNLTGTTWDCVAAIVEA